MSRVKSPEPKFDEQMIPLSAVNGLIQSLQGKVLALENKYLHFVRYCSQIIRNAHSSFDQSINEHLISSHPPTKIIENLTRQKFALQGELANIEKMAKAPEANLDFVVKFMEIVRKSKEKILEKIGENKAKYSVQSVLLSMEEKLYLVANKIEMTQQDKGRIAELENLLKQKDRNYEILQQYVMKVKKEQAKGLCKISSLTDLKHERVNTPSATSRISIQHAGRSSPGLFSSQKDHEIVHLKQEVKYLQEKFRGLTGKAEKIVKKREIEISNFKNEIFQMKSIKKVLESVFIFFDHFEDNIRTYLDKLTGKVNGLGKVYLRFEVLKSITVKQRMFRLEENVGNDGFIKGLEKIIEDLKEELREKEEKMRESSEEIGRITRNYKEINEKYQTQIIEKNKGNDGKMEKIEELIRVNQELKMENVRLSNYKNDVDSEIMDLKDYFQADLDNLSSKIEKLFSENLMLKQRNEELQEKCAKVMTEKEKLMIQVYETKEISNFSLKSEPPSSLALKQELKLANSKLEAKSKQFSQVRLTLHELLENFYKITHENYSKFEKSIEKKIINWIYTLNQYKKCLKQPNTAPKLMELQKSHSKLILVNAQLTQRCNYYQDVIDELNLHCKQLSTDSSPTENFSLLQQRIIEKDQIIAHLQQMVSALEVENQKLAIDMENIEFTFQNAIADSKNYEESKSKVPGRLRISSTDLIKTFDSKIFSGTASEVEFNYTLEGTTIKSEHGEITPMASDNEDIADLEIIY